MNQDDQEVRAYQLGFAYAQAQVDRIQSNDIKLAHYTTAEAALQILDTRSILLRNASLMNDFSEIAHGQACVRHALDRDYIGPPFRATLNQIRPGLSDKLLTGAGWNFEEVSRSHTYMLSLSEHYAHDGLGRLSMWRAYGGPVSGVALVFNTDFMGADAQDKLKSYSSPVFYGGPLEFEDEFRGLIVRIEQNMELFRRLDEDMVVQILGNALQFAKLSIKHNGFEEEREWRIIHQPWQHHSPFIKQEVMCIRGLPQIVFRAPLRDSPVLAIPELDLSRLIHRIIIGPTSFPDQVQLAFIHKLSSLGVADAGQKVMISDIPLRQLH